MASTVRLDFIEPPYRQTRVKMDSSRPNWLDLPQGIVELILNKLHFADQIHALAVSKTWRDCKDHVRCSDCLPWVISYQCESDSESEDHTHQKESDVHSFTCELFDPYSRKAHEVSNSIKMDLNGGYVPLASKHGWVLFCGEDEYSTLFLHNPFTNDIRSVSTSALVGSDQMRATIKGNPTSPECEIFTLAILDDGHLCMDTEKSSGFTSAFIVEMNVDETFHSVLYMKENIYCLFDNGVLNSYSLEDKSWKLLTSGFPEPYESCDSMDDGWLMEINENLIMVRLDVEGEICKYKWMVFRFDWSQMSWVVETSLKSCAIYINVSGGVAFSSPLTNRNGKKLEGCKLFYHNEFFGVAGGIGFKCYSLSEAVWTEIESEEYGWISRPEECELSFIEPPYFGI